MNQSKTTRGNVAMFAAMALLAMAVGSGLAASPEYVGAAKCKMCHKAEYEAWKGSPHAGAYETLEAADREKEECVTCHVTGHGQPAAASAVLEGVQCEACHGPGSLYKSPKIMSKSKYKEDPDGMHQMSLDAGLLVPNEKTCRGCHNEKSADFKGFNYEEALAKIKHWE